MDVTNEGWTFPWACSRKDDHYLRRDEGRMDIPLDVPREDGHFFGVLREDGHSRRCAQGRMIILVGVSIKDMVILLGMLREDEHSLMCAQERMVIFLGVSKEGWSFP